MSSAKLTSFSAIRSSLNQKSTSRTTITCSELETFFSQCPTPRLFNQILCQTICSGLIKDTYAASRILKFSTDSSFIPLDHSHKIFAKIDNSNGFIWNTMLKAFVQRNRAKDAIFLYKSMLKNGYMFMDNYTYPILIQACSLRFSEFEGREVHDHVVKMGFCGDVYVVNNLINVYSVCGQVGDARKVFDESPVLDLVSWNSLLAGYVLVGSVDNAKVLYARMPEQNIIASNSMIVLLGRSGRLNEARQLLEEMDKKDVVSWTAMISCYEQNLMYKEALDMFLTMCRKGINVDEVVIVSVLSACSHLASVRMGESVHGLVAKVGFESYINLQNALIHMYSKCEDVSAAEKLFKAGCVLDLISWNSMISGYVKCGLVEKARDLFDRMPEKDVVSWSSMISGNAQHGNFSETLALFHEMLHQGVKPDETTLVSVVSACAQLAALDQGKWAHAYIRKNGMKVKIILGTTLINMYMKCGSVEDAMEVFDGMDEKGVSSWNALILGLAMNGQVERSLERFEEMKRCGMVPNEITFVAVLGACRHIGLVEKGREYFDSMVKDYDIEPGIKHYGCLVDLLGRAGFLKEAEEVIDTMPMPADVATWGALLGACKKHGDKEMGERLGRKLIELQPEHDGFHVLLSNIYASKGNWENVEEIRDIMVRQGVVKTPGCSIIEAGGVVHEFMAGDKSHPRIKEIEAMLAEMVRRLRSLGYAPGTDEVLLDIDEEEKETNLFRHSEKLAIAFGLFATNAPAPIRIVKNLRICSDCHEAAKLVSKAFDREIVVRDRHRFHHFNCGSCSCNDYW
ncbi:pentatricopeptide repeat-containing protein At3g62890-like [Salvia splendens]|nr:pentatricopeptide repeat-containing protein At3g62890-like [Salvia splendens]XP_042064069.1 pentatricopeptide repeat-containing protein At3g62890-like [Salvia splendens]XP_042064070.1 pentatricopeptide repeat-containing protein At3g62890-like [Salvia splendens]XP_042064071.1 pentatricopeptide repeat-containing protein At3g62890-like [Salvia splendens]